VRWRNTSTKVEEPKDIGHVFVMTGAVPNTRWLDGCVALDKNGFIKTGPDSRARGARRRALAADPAAAPARDEPSPASSRSAMRAAATSSGWRPPSARARFAVSFVHQVLSE